MNVFIEPIDLSRWDLFDRVPEAGRVEPFLATKKMRCGDLLLVHVGKQTAGRESGVYAYGTIVRDPYVLEGGPDDYCNGRLSVDVLVEEIRQDEPIFDLDEVSSFSKHLRTRHAIGEEHHDLILARCPKFTRAGSLRAGIKQVDRDVLTFLIPRVVERGSTVTYTDLSRRIEAALGRHYNLHFGFNSPLGRIQEACKELGLPCISSMVVNVKGELPGGFYEFYREIHPEVANESDATIRRREQGRCKEHSDWGPLVEFYGLTLDRSLLGVDTRAYVEGARKTSVKITEEITRSDAARTACLKSQGGKCVICGFDSAETYGVPGIIHVHHVVPISRTVGSHDIDPERDLAPVCPNCHAFIHSKQAGFYTMEEAREAYLRRRP